MPFFPKGRRGVLFCAPIWNITRKRRRGGPLRPPVPRCGTFPHSSRRGGACPSRHVSGMAMARRRGGSQTRPSSADHDTYRSRRLTGFRPAGRPPLPTAAKEAKRRRGWAPMGVPAHSRATPGPPFTGVIPIPFRRSSGAQNTVPGVDSFRATGPWSGAKFWPAPFYNRAWFRPAVAEGAGRGRAGRSRSHESGTGGSQTRPYGDVSLPRRSFGFFPIAGKETRPAGRNPVRRRAESSRPTGVTVHGRRAGPAPPSRRFQDLS